MSTLRDSIGDRTIRDFGEQWVHYGDNAGFYGSTELFADIIGPLLALSDLRGLRIAEIGSGAGRIVAMMIDAGAAHVLAVEPSDGHVPRGFLPKARSCDAIASSIWNAASSG